MIHIYFNQFSSMEHLWWLAWGVVFFWIYSIPNKITERNKEKDRLIELLKAKFDLNQIDKKEYLEKQNQIEKLYEYDKE